jgi:hypothetical protein
MSKVVCIESGTGQGYRLKAAFSRDAENHEFIVYCDGPFVAGVVDTPSKTSGAKRKRNHHRHHKKKR